MKKFDLKKALNGDKVVTADGRLVTDIKIINDSAPKTPKEATSLEYNTPEKDTYIQGIEGTIHNKDFNCPYPFYHNGVAHKYGLETTANLFMA